MPPAIPGTLTAASLRRKEQLWKTSDERAQKEGPRNTIYWNTGERYQGEWSDNKKHGKGTVVYKNGDKYEGDWSSDTRQGLGTLWIFREGKYKVRYNGEWRDDQPTGHGTFFDDNGDTYEGDWLSGRRHGKGRAVYGGRPADGFGGDVYEGGWEDDVKCGAGTMMYASGDIYEGQWAGDTKHGPGSYFHMSKGKRYDGVWSEGTAKCGSYSEVHAPPPGTVGALPPIELKAPDAVLMAAKTEVLA
ncbi:hypothetical protein FOA52_016101 [Chlamydomonas sp. UWO 241]|nr:hypothetical protein FOA52_016101 [Chlamydomonas sp. UWO 241]